MIKAVRAKNFLSWKELDFPLSSGVTLIEGWNYDDETPEGSGKSAILNAISWAFYGGIPKDAKTDDVIREGTKGCEVEVEFESGWKIVRSRKPNDVYLWSPETKDKVKGKDAKETQALIEQFVGMSFETFCQSVYFAQNYPAKFVTANETDKAKILSEIQDLSVFDKARKETMAQIKTLEAEEFSISKDASHLEQSCRDLEQKIKDFKKLKEAAETEIKSNIKRMGDQIQMLESGAEEIVQRLAAINVDELNDKLKELKTDATALTEERAKSKAELSGLDAKKASLAKVAMQLDRKERELKLALEAPTTWKKKIESAESRYEGFLKEVEEANQVLAAAEAALANPKKDKCPTCKQDWDGDSSHYEREVAKAKKAVGNAQGNIGSQIQLMADLKRELKSAEALPGRLREEIAELKAEKDDIKIPSTETLEKSISDVGESLKAISEIQEAIEKELRYHGKLESELEAKGKEIDRMKAALEAERKKNTAQFDDKIAAAEMDLRSKLIKAGDILEKLKDIKASLVELEILKDGYKEVKSFVFQSMLESMTRKANRYLTELFEQPVKINFTNEGEGGELSKIQVEVTIDGHPRPLGLYSGGQFRRIQLAVDLALSDIVAERSKSLKLRIFDEYMKDLSEVSMEKVLKLLETLKGSTILIEHNSIFKSIVANTFQVELVDGVSRRA